MEDGAACRGGELICEILHFINICSTCARQTFQIHDGAHGAYRSEPPLIEEHVHARDTDDSSLSSASFPPPPSHSYGVCTKKRKRGPRSRLPSVIFFPLRVSKNSSRRTERSTTAAMLYEGLSASANTRVWLSFFSVSAFYGGAYVRKYLRSAFREMYGDVLYRGRAHELGNNVICEERFSEIPSSSSLAARRNPTTRPSSSFVHTHRPLLYSCDETIFDTNWVFFRAFARGAPCEIVTSNQPTWE